MLSSAAGLIAAAAPVINAVVRKRSANNMTLVTKSNSKEQFMSR